MAMASARCTGAQFSGQPTTISRCNQCSAKSMSSAHRAPTPRPRPPSFPSTLSHHNRSPLLPQWQRAVTPRNRRLHHRQLQVAAMSGFELADHAVALVESSNALLASVGPDIAASGSALLASVGPDIALGPGVVAKVLDGLGEDALRLLATTVVVVPVCKRLKVSPILGFLGAGVFLNQLGVFQNGEELATVSELGILFLLFSMGLELSLDRLKELAKFAFGLGLWQMILCTAIFTSVGLPPDNPLSAAHLLGPVGSWLSSAAAALSLPLPALPPCPADLRGLAATLTLDEGVIIALALSLSSSAFVLNLLSEQDELGTRHGSATLGVLLLQDIAVVPLLAVLPVLEGGFSAAASVAAASDTFSSTALASTAAAVAGGAAAVGPAASGALQTVGSAGGAALGAFSAADIMSPGHLAVAQQLLVGSLEALGGLGVMLVGGQLIIKPAFRVVKQSDSAEAFLALCLLAVTGTALLSARLGFSDSLGAFLAGAILSSSDLKHEVQRYTAPFEKLLLGLFFMTTGSSVDLDLLAATYPTILLLLSGLLVVKTAAITAIGPRFGLSLGESVRTAFLLSQGGEFAFVVLALAKELGVLPEEANRMLIIVVVLSMALTPLLNEAGKAAADALQRWEAQGLSAGVPGSPEGAGARSLPLPQQSTGVEGVADGSMLLRGDAAGGVLPSAARAPSEASYSDGSDGTVRPGG